MKSVFRLAARGTSFARVTRGVVIAPVSEKRIGLSRGPRRGGYGH